MNRDYLFQPKINGNVSFRQQTIKLQDENGNNNRSSFNNGNNGINVAKSSILSDNDQGREFGKDLTNLNNNENVNPNMGLRKSMEGINRDSKNLSVSILTFFNNNLIF
jgi:hypothetical protein